MEFHSDALRRMGAEEGLVRKIAAADLSDLDAREQAVMRLADKVVFSPPEITDEEFAAIRRLLGYDDGQMAELVQVIAYALAISRFTDSLGLNPAELYPAE